MIGFCSVTDIRNNNVAFTPDAIGSTVIRERIETAEETVITNLSKIYTQAQLTSYSDSLILKQLTILKTMEITLVKLYGATREVDTVDDIVYWKGRYNTLLKSIISGETKIESGGVIESPVSSPKITNDVEPVYTDRGLDGFEQD